MNSLFTAKIIIIIIIIGACGAMGSHCESQQFPGKNSREEITSNKSNKTST